MCTIRQLTTCGMSYYTRNEMKSNSYSPKDAEAAERHGQSGGQSLVAGRNKQMERESKGCTSVLIYMFIFVNVDVWKQVTTYGIKYYNGGKYPIPQTLVIAVTELAKLVVFMAMSAREGTLLKIKVSFLFAIPSLLYAANNNMFFYALHYTTPPIWNIVIQMRIAVAALAYRVIFKKVISSVQWLGLFLLISAIVMTELSAGEISGVNYKDLTIPIILAMVVAVTSTAAGFVMEYLFKNDSRTFCDMQVQLYFFGTLGCFFLYALESSSEKAPDMGEVTLNVWILLLVCITMTVLTGFTVAYIVKRLDNIVKLYSQALSNMMTSIACTFLFPEDFYLNRYFIGCLLLMMVAIFLYESKGISCGDLFNKGSDSQQRKKPNGST